MLPPVARKYVVDGLLATPVVLKTLLTARDEGSPIWDVRLDPDRFSLREVLAHLADWEPIWLDRVHRVLNEEHPILPTIDEGQLALDRHYATSDPLASLERFCLGREALSRCLAERSEFDWSRTCEREFVGPLTLENLATMMLGHDAYHLRQIAESIAAGN